MSTTAEERAITPDIIAEEWARRLAADAERKSPNDPVKDWGWSFMYTPAAVLDHAKVMLVGLNPGGDQLGEPGSWDYTAGVNAYLDQDWLLGHGTGRAPLQRQVQALVNAVGVAWEDVAHANLVPFRSPSWDELQDNEAALAWSLEALWRPLLARTPAGLFLSIGKRPALEIAKLMGAREKPSYEARWGRQTITEYEDPQGRIILGLPHLSRYRLFSGARAEHVSGVVSQARRRALAPERSA